MELAICSKLLIRADAAPEIGTGHVMRCLALGQAWSRLGGEVVFAAAELPAEMEAGLVKGGYRVERVQAHPGGADDLAATNKLACSHGCKWVVVDGYHFGSSFQLGLKEFGHRLLWLDDFGHADHYHADIIVNQNGDPPAGLYKSRDSSTRLLLGSRYVLLRQEFRPWRFWQRRVRQTASKTVVTFGGADEGNVTSRVVDALLQRSWASLHCIVVCGPASRHRAELERSFGGHQSVEIRASVSDMASLLAEADVAVIAAGTTTWEAMFMQLPIIAFQVADNQTPVVESLRRRRWATCLEPAGEGSFAKCAEGVSRLLESPDLRAMAVCEGRGVVDGMGVDRIIQAMNPLPVYLRPVTIDDRRTIWQWANDPATRAVSRHRDSIKWEEHVAWFDSKLRDPNCFFLLAHDLNDRAIGQVRFDVSGNEAEVSISLDPAARGEGFGPLILQLGAQELFSCSPTRVIHAFIREENQRSRRAFDKVGYELVEDPVASRDGMIHMVLEDISTEGNGDAH